MILPVVINANGSPAVQIRVVKELDSRLEHKSDQPVRSGPAVVVISGDWLIEHIFDQVRFSIFLENSAPVLPRERIHAPHRSKREYRLS